MTDHDAPSGYAPYKRSKKFIRNSRHEASCAAPSLKARKGREGFILHVEAIPDRLGRDAILRLRLALKFILRSCSLRCVRVVEAPAAVDGEQQPPPAAPGGLEGGAHG